MMRLTILGSHIQICVIQINLMFSFAKIICCDCRHAVNRYLTTIYCIHRSVLLSFSSFQTTTFVVTLYSGLRSYKEKVADGTCVIVKVDSKENNSDVGTKRVSKIIFEYLTHNLIDKSLRTNI